MNELIKQLAHHAWVDNDQLDACGYTDLQKFAELIVQECIDWINLNLGLVDEQAREDLMKYFGVK